MHGDGVAAVFQVVTLFMGVKGEFPLLADRDKPSVQLKGATSSG
jgi:hypothetical protein